MKTRDFLRRYAYVYLYVTAFFLGCAGLFLHSVETAGATAPFLGHPVIVVDAGHGTPDGGTTGQLGTREDAINLQIAKRLDACLALMGYETAMTRTGESCVATEGESIREKKHSDLKNRTEQVNSLANAILVSIHQNHFPDPQYSGPQVFYTDGADVLARELQQALSGALSPGSRREAKGASGIYLMEHIRHPGILVECGFLSNLAEEQKLCTADYQKKLAAVMAAVMARFADGQV